MAILAAILFRRALNLFILCSGFSLNVIGIQNSDAIDTWTLLSSCYTLYVGVASHKSIKQPTSLQSLEKNEGKKLKREELC